MKDPRDVVLEPVVSEKSYDQIEDSNTYTFLVDRRSNKTEIKEAVQSIFDVKVLSVNTMNRKGKLKRTGYIIGRRKDTKRALVTLAVGDSIDIFEV
jgi:large subunit ribosomal protein L23